MRSPFLTCLSVGFAALLAALSTPSLASNQVTHTFKPSKNSTLSPSRVVSTRQSANRSVVAAAASEVTDRAFSMIGTPYRWGGTTPKKGFDCSGLVNYVFQDVDDVDLPRTARAIYNMDNNKVSRGKLQPGDLVFFRIRSRSVDHVGIYVGNDRFARAARQEGPRLRPQQQLLETPLPGRQAHPADHPRPGRKHPQALIPAPAARSDAPSRLFPQQARAVPAGQQHRQPDRRVGP